MRGIKFISLIDHTGYGQAGRAYLRGLIHAGVPVTWQPMELGLAWGIGYQPAENPKIDDPVLKQVLHKKIDYDTVVVHTVPEYYAQWRELEAGKTMVGMTVWESDRLPAHWPKLLDIMDMILVPSRWNQETFQSHALKTPVEILPHIFDLNQNTSPPPGNDSSLFTFYHIGSWTDRKSPWYVLQAYWQAFRREDPVRLILKTDWSDSTKFRYGRRWRYVGSKLHSTWLAYLRLKRRVPNPARVKLIPSSISNPAIDRLHETSDCYIALPHAEGWGLGAFDAAGHGKPVIMSNFGGQLEFLPAADAYLVDTVETEAGKLTRNRIPGHWGRPDLDQAARLMRHVFENQAEARGKGLRLQENVLARFNEERITGRFVEILRNLTS